MPCIFGICDVEIKYECRLELDLSIMDLNYKELLQIAIKATVLAGNEVLKQYEEGFETIIKADGSPVTTADLAANDILTEHLNKTGIAIISEEGAWYDHTFRQAHPYWCLDPIDGTRDFVDRTDEFCVSVGLIAENTSKIGILYAPALHLFYFAAEGVGSFKFIGSVNEMTQLVSLDGFLDAFMQSSERLPIDKSPNENLFMASRFHRSPKIEEYIQELKRKYPDLELVTIGSAIKLGYMAEGKAHQYLRYTTFNFWDVAGGHAIAKYAGLQLLQPNSHQEIHYENENMKIEGYFLKW